MLFPLPGILFHQMCMPPSLLSFKSLLEGPLLHETVPLATL